MAGIEGLNGYKKQIESLRKDFRNEVTRKYREHISGILYELAMGTPQWSGDAAASWTVIVGKDGVTTGANPSVETGLKYDPWWKIPERRYTGHMDAVNMAIDRNKDAISSIRYNSYVAIRNNSAGSNAMSSGEVNPRRETGIRPDYTMQATMNYVIEKYSRRHITLTQS